MDKEKQNVTKEDYGEGPKKYIDEDLNIYEKVDIILDGTYWETHHLYTEDPENIS